MFKSRAGMQHVQKQSRHATCSKAEQACTYMEQVGIDTADLRKPK